MPNELEPPEDLLGFLNVRLVSSLGGERNRHWLVAGSERVVLRRWAAQPTESIEYERGIVERLYALGWPVAPLSDPIFREGFSGVLPPFFPVSPHQIAHAHDPRARGRLLADLHLDTSRIQGLGRRPGWRRCEAILTDPKIDRVLSENELTRPEEVRIVRWHLDRARLRIEGLRMENWPGIPVHGDFAPWNLHYEEGHLTGLLDFELSRDDHRVADFSLSWRGKYDLVIEGYEDVSPLSPEERAAISPVWWAGLIERSYRDMLVGRKDDGWTVAKLLIRSPIMGPDARDLP